MSTKSFEVTVRGQYQAFSEGSGVPGLKNYEETFNLPSQEAALSTICKHLLAPRLRKKYADFIRFRTHEMVGIRLVGYTPNPAVLQMGIDEMNLSELSDFCILRQIMLDPTKHADKDIFTIRAMVQKIYSEKRQAIKERETTKQGDAAKETDALRRANDLPPVSSDPLISVNEKKLTNAAQNAKLQAKSTVSAPESVESMEPLPEPEVDAPSGQESRTESTDGLFE